MNPPSPVERGEAVRSIYQEVILDHYRRPRHRGSIKGPHTQLAMRNPTCGDEILLHVAVEDDDIREIRFEGSGCAISQAAASMMAEQLQGRSRADAAELTGCFRELLHGSLDPSAARALGDLRALAGVARLPGRVRCAMLAWTALEAALEAGPPGGEGEPVDAPPTASAPGDPAG